MTWADRDRIRGDDFKLKEERFKLDALKKFFTQRVEALEQVAQRGGR